MIIETGLALCVVNLPIIYGLLRRQRAEKTVKRLHSFVSLKSSNSDINTSVRQGSASFSKRHTKSSNFKTFNIQMVHDITKFTAHAVHNESTSELNDVLEV